MEQNPGDVEVRSELGDLFAASGDFGKAQAEYEDIKRRAPKLPLGYLKLGELRIKQGKWQGAIPEFELAIRVTPHSGAALAELVQLYLKERRPEAAIACCVRRLRQNGQDAFACDLLGQVYGGLKQYPNAEEALHRASQLEPNNPAHLLHLGRMYTEGGQYRKARETYQKALAQQPGLWEAANDLAYLLSEHPESDQDLNAALSWAQKAQQARPDDANILDTLGWAYLKRGEMTRALESLGRARQKTPDLPMVNYHLGVALYKTGRREEAKASLGKSVSGSGDFPGRDEALKLLRGL